MSDKNDNDETGNSETKTGRREFLTANIGLIGGLAGGVAISPDLRSLARDWWAELTLPQSPIKSLDFENKSLIISLVEDAHLDELTLIAPDGSAAAQFAVGSLDWTEYRYPTRKLTDGHYRVVAVRNDKIIQQDGFGVVVAD